MRPHNSAESFRTSSNSNSRSALKQIISMAYESGSFIMMEEDKGYDHQVPTYQEGKQKYTHNQALGRCCLNLPHKKIMMY
jgi:hypothetical protein